MKAMQTIFLFIAFVFSINDIAADPYDEIATAMRSGDAKQVSAFFGPTVDLTLLDKEEVYGKGQAELILRDFYAKNPPKSFQLIHKGGSQEGTLYGIGTFLSTNGKSFRVSFYLKNSGGKKLIQELRIEAQ